MHHVWKRGAVACMAAALLMGSVPALAWQAPEDDAWQAASREGVAARFFVGSDVHIGRNSDADAKSSPTPSTYLKRSTPRPTAYCWWEMSPTTALPANTIA